MYASVIMSTYNQPDWLEKVLWGDAVQTVRDFEIVIADDGSTGVTAERIEAMRRATGLAIRHVWHEDRGFRKCTIVNAAIVAAHQRFARPPHYLYGGYYKLPLPTSERITPNDIRSNVIFNARWLYRAGAPLNFRMFKFHLSECTAALCCCFTTTPATFNGMCASAWKQDILRVNGFDERMQYGGLDRELQRNEYHRRARILGACGADKWRPTDARRTASGADR